MMRVRQKLGYKWIIVAISFIMVFVCLGFCSSNKGVYLSAITEAFGIKRSLFSINDSCRYVATAIVNLFFGTLISRYGARKLIGAGFISLIISMLIYATATNIWVFYIGGCFLGIGLSWTTTTMVGYVVNCWCPEHKGTIMGLILAANGIGGAVATQIVTPIIYQEGKQFGFQEAYKLVALILGITGVLVVVLFRNAPKHVNTNTPRAQEKKQAWVGITFQEALKKPYFYTSAICIFLTGAALQGVTGISAAHMTDVGLDAGYMATIVSAQSLVLFGSKLLAGVMHDRYGLRITMLFCDVATVIAFASLAIVTPTAGGKILAVVFAVTAALALPLETIMLPLISEYVFGQKSFTQMLGIFVSVNTAGYAVGTPVVNLVYDVCGTYTPVLLVLVVVMIVVAIEFQRILSTVDKEKNQ